MRELKSIKINSISLIPQAKNNLPVFFPASNMIELKNIVLNSADGLLNVIVYDIDTDIIKDCSVAPDVLCNMAHEYLRSGAKLDRFHSGRAIRRSQAAVVESYIVQRGDPRFLSIRDYENKSIDVTGAWVVAIKLFAKNLKALYRGMNAWNGVSIFGEAQFGEKPEFSRHSKVPFRMVMR
jgi:hypothetical protein